VTVRPCAFPQPNSNHHLSTEYGTRPGKLGWLGAVAVVPVTEPGLRYGAVVIDPRVHLSHELVRKIVSFREFRMGVHRVAVVLRDGSTVHDVFVSGNQLVGVGSTGSGLGPITFSAADIVDVEDQNDS
jgi:hypothetical protein